MAHTKAQKSTKGNRDSVSKRLGVKLYGGQTAKNGSIIIRQRGLRVKAGEGVKVGSDFTLYSIRDGVVTFGMRQGSKFVSVMPQTS
ncbi:50S ribosomal protein L27 [Candidatus Roizmanbacteria bacterium RIFCSPHIGHO2_01_FULL_39_12b]|uniref:Large ribosomal subunit protein bL27 n=1 Tax=Candidatus Roizmanbacteria bacterium RIFCSPHIGHO2_01_FULL_39_12b TaxID=1802030 RepID=A0A1F7GEU7_9BACT|nr:MAG: 50S ribosomal protein L27 [Candidatus Roizmanbacteria bacterium RIFCSPHIGHO2_01_FULL_39_12b]OGK46658.1 MAG: 50S ribosomal protein L27 [Candidatus Roizmanbacteria bacterium RIFCSPLOWO2_01_FULL_39_19]